MTTLETPVLAPSFTALVMALAGGRESPQVLDQALFYFGCAREHLFPPEGQDDRTHRPSELLSTGQPVERQMEIWRMVKAALLNAEQEGRARWRPLGGHANFVELASLLGANGIDVQVPKSYMAGYDLPALKEWLAADAPDLRVLWV